MEETHGWIGNWSPGIGDPTFIGWLTVLAYLGVAYLCLVAFKDQKVTRDRRDGAGAYVDAASSLWRAFQGFRRPIPDVPVRARLAMFWLLLAGAFVVLGVNKQLDLQSLLTEVGRELARAQGWYEQRRTAQLAVVALVALVTLGIFYLLIRLLRDLVWEVRWALVGVGVTLVFVLIRAISIHGVDAAINRDVIGLRMNWILELTGIGIVGRAAWKARRRPQSAR